MSKIRLLRNVCLAFLVASFFGVGAAWSNTCNDHAYTAFNKKGSLIIYPLYMAGDGLYTKINLINTSRTRAVVAKVVVRSHNYSQELLDFFVYLSPNDMWDGSIGVQAGKVRVMSDDDSVWNPATRACASAASPFSYALQTPCPNVPCAEDSNNYGYVEVFEAWTVDWATVPKGDHCQAIKNVWDLFANGKGDPEDTIQPVLSGSAELVLPTDYVDIPTYHIACYAPQAILTVGKETFIGQQANNSMSEVEAALSKDEFYIPYYNTAGSGTVAIFTFPTKLSACPICDPVTGKAVNRLRPGISGNFFVNNGYKVNYQFTTYDMSEHSKHEGCPVSPCKEITTLTFPQEVNAISAASAPYAKGWMRLGFAQSTNGISFSAGNDITFTGAPVIGIVAQVTPKGIAVSEPSFDFGDVTYAGNADPSYQLWSACGGAAPGPQPASTVIDGETVTCTTDCSDTFPGSIPNIVQCETWQDDNCQ